MAVEVQDAPERSRYEARVDGAVVGFAVYQPAEGALVFTHTEIDDAYEGQGVGSALARGALDDVRSRGLAVVAQCPFVAGWIDRHPDYEELVQR